MGFPTKDAVKLLKDCHRRCCVCHRYCGVKMELDHIEPRAGSHNDAIENAIPVCFECHAEIHLYNPDHPLGRRFSPDELKLHREQWLRICKEFPGIFVGAPAVSEAGMMERLLHEINFNMEVASHSQDNEIGCPFEVAQFDRALADGTYALFNDETRTKLREAYRWAKRANTFIATMLSDISDGRVRETGIAIRKAREPFEALGECLRNQLIPAQAKDENASGVDCV